MQLYQHFNVTKISYLCTELLTPLREKKLTPTHSSAGWCVNAWMRNSITRQQQGSERQLPQSEMISEQLENPGNIHRNGSDLYEAGRLFRATVLKIHNTFLRRFSRMLF